MSEQFIKPLGEMKNGEYHLRGEAISDLIMKEDFISAIWFTWTGEHLSQENKKILTACFIACLDHGSEPPSASVARIVASCGKPVADSVAAGLLTFGTLHGNAASGAATWLKKAIQEQQSEEEVVQEALSNGRRIYGIGHPVYSIDPRVQKVVEILKQQMQETPHVDLALRVAEYLTRIKGKPLPLNIDGVVGAVIADLGAPDVLADAIFISARTVGLIAQACDESGRTKSYLRGKSKSM